MNSISYSQKALDDLYRLMDFMETVSPQTLPKMMNTIQTAIDQLAYMPEMGRVSEFSQLRQLTIPFGRNAYFVLYDYQESHQHIDIVAMRHSRELGW